MSTLSALRDASAAPNTLVLHSAAANSQFSGLST